MVCKFCHSSQVSIRRDVRSSHNEKIYHLYACHECRCHFFNLLQHGVSLKGLYDDLSVNRGDFPLEFAPSKKWARQVRLIHRIHGRPVRSVLDAGCRTGDFLLHFGPETERVGVEVSDEFAGIARKRGLEIHNDFLENVKFQRKFEAVTSYAILEHLEDPVKFLDSLESILEPGGILVVMVPAYGSLKRWLMDATGGRWHMYIPPEHLNFLSATFLDRFLKSRGYQLVRREYTSGGMIFSSGNTTLPRMLLQKLVQLMDRSLMNRLPLFDHMYSYYILKERNDSYSR